MSDPVEPLVLARAKLNFARKGHGERCWDADFTEAEALCGAPLLPLDDAERAEFIAQARHELGQESQANGG